MSFKNILIAVDDSEFAAQAAKVAVELARPLKARLGFVHVFDPTVGPGTMWSVPADRLMESSEEQAKRLLARFQAETAQKAKAAEFLESGKPASRIVHVAKKWPADLIVMGSHGRGKIKGLILGSVSQEVLSHAPCPVLVVQAKS